MVEADLGGLVFGLSAGRLALSAGVLQQILRRPGVVVAQAGIRPRRAAYGKSRRIRRTARRADHPARRTRMASTRNHCCADPVALQPRSVLRAAGGATGAATRPC